MEEKKLGLEELRFNGLKFSIGDEEKTISELKSIKEIGDMIKWHIKFIETYQPYIDYYKDFENKINASLDGQAVYFEENGYYEVGENFATFLEYESNHDSSEYIKKLIKNKFGKNNLEIDAEYSYCYVYSKNKEEAARFLLFAYREIIKPFLEKL